MKKTLTIVSLIALTACQPTPEEQFNVQRQLPPGCTVKDVGSYGDITHLIVVDCPGRSTRTMSYPQRSGKTTHPIAVVQID